MAGAGAQATLDHQPLRPFPPEQGKQERRASWKPFCLTSSRNVQLTYNQPQLGWGRSDPFLHQNGMWHLLRLDGAGICFSLKRTTSENTLLLKADCLPNLTSGMAGASGRLRMVAFTEPCSPRASTQGAWVRCKGPSPQLAPRRPRPPSAVPVEWRR